MPSRCHPLAGFMHKLSTAVPQSSSVLHRRRDPQAGALARLVIAAPAALRYENLCIIPARLMEGAGDLSVSRRRRCP